MAQKNVTDAIDLYAKIAGIREKRRKESRELMLDVARLQDAKQRTSLMQERNNLIRYAQTLKGENQALKEQRVNQFGDFLERLNVGSIDPNRVSYNIGPSGPSVGIRASSPDDRNYELKRQRVLHDLKNPKEAFRNRSDAVDYILDKGVDFNDLDVQGALNLRFGQIASPESSKRGSKMRSKRRSFNTEEEAEKANIPAGEEVLIGGVLYKAT